MQVAGAWSHRTGALELLASHGTSAEGLNPWLAPHGIHLVGWMSMLEKEKENQVLPHALLYDRLPHLIVLSF